ncbi:MAG: hypothetical protein A2044_08610 [Candidatus Firestonebacteria bacterium GWA2_43_8]|nr:MAG: hypothetical protein A2044_08610 [Candidatus Firestonebacteria bacterium GWA2_43_8]
MKIAAVIIITEKTVSPERCLKSVAGWTSEIIIVAGRSVRLNKKVIKKYEAGIVLLEAGREIMVQRGIKAAKADWVVVLNNNEEVSIPLKIEMRSKLSGVIQDRVNVRLVTDAKDLWVEKKPSETRIFKRYAWCKGAESAVFEKPIRQFKAVSLPSKPLFLRNDIKKILIIKLRGIGDTVLMTPLLSNAKKYYKNALITCVVSSASKEILMNNPNVDRIITFDGTIRTFLKLFIKEKYDLVLCPQASLRTAVLALASRAKIKVVNNHNGKNYFTSLSVQKPEEYEDAIDRDLDCLKVTGVPVKSKEVEVRLLKSEFIDIRKLGFSGKDTIIGLSVSASRQNKMWFKERFAELADKLIKEYKFKIIFIEDPANPQAIKDVVKLMKCKPFTICEEDLRKVMALLSGFDLFIGNDSGLLHAAVALSVPTISIVGPEEAKIFNPYSRKDKHFTLSADVDCKPCWKSDCDVPLCLDAIPVKQVLETVIKAVKK